MKNSNKTNEQLLIEIGKLNDKIAVLEKSEVKLKESEESLKESEENSGYRKSCTAGN